MNNPRRPRVSIFAGLTQADLKGEGGHHPSSVEIVTRTAAHALLDAVQRHKAVLARQQAFLAKIDHALDRIEQDAARALLALGEAMTDISD